MAIGTKAGKLLLCRDFRDISRTLVEDCVSSLPQLIRETQEHTFVEHNSLRLTYLPLGPMFVMSINDKASNILEDTEVLRAIHSAIHAVIGGGITEEAICMKALEIIFTLDDIISIGYRNVCSESLLANSLEMDSANERLVDNQRKIQEMEAKKKAKEFELAQRKKVFSPKDAVSGSDSYKGSSSTDVMSSTSKPAIFAFAKDEVQASGVNKTSSGDGKKTLVLGAKKKGKANEPVSEANNKGKDAPQAETAKAKTSLVADVEEKYNPLTAAVVFQVTEQVECKLTREGKLKHFAIKGDISFVIKDPKLTKLAILVQSEQKANLNAKVPPTFNRKNWTEDSVLIAKDDKVNFQKNLTVPAIKYGVESEKGNFNPFVFSVWQSGNSLTVECEFNGKQTWLDRVANLQVKIPGIGSKPKLIEKSNSEYTYEGSSQEILWTIKSLGEGAEDTASLNVEFPDTIEEEDTYPWTIDFTANKPFGDFEIVTVKNLETDEDATIGVETAVKISSFQVLAA